MFEMPKIKVSGQILSSIFENSKDPNVAEFLRLLCYEEAEHPGQWKWKEEYLKIMGKQILKQGGGNENK
jgi:hypothetical protein